MAILSFWWVSLVHDNMVFDNSNIGPEQIYGSNLITNMPADSRLT